MALPEGFLKFDGFKWVIDEEVGDIAGPAGPSGADGYDGAAGATGPAGPGITPAGDLSGSSSTQTVVGIQNRPVNPNTSPAIANGNVLTYDTTLSQWIGKSLSTFRYTAPNSSTLLCWKLDETTAPFLSTGTNTATNLTVALGSVTPNSTGAFNKAVYFDSTISATSVLSSSNSSVEPALQACTVSCWVKLTSFTASGILIAKAYRNDGTYNTPFNSLQISLGPSPDGSWAVGVTTGGTRTLTSINNPKLPTCIWTFLAFTWDGNNLLSYMNGLLTSTTNIAFGPNNIDFNNHGPWNIGNTGTVTTGGVKGIIEDVRVESVVRSANYLSALYNAGIGMI